MLIESALIGPSHLEILECLGIFGIAGLIEFSCKGEMLDFPEYWKAFFEVMKAFILMLSISIDDA